MWTEKRGEYSYFNNNCTKFAVHMYNKYSADHIPAGIFDMPHPNRVAALIYKARQQNVAMLKDVDPDKTELPVVPVNQEVKRACPPGAKSSFIDSETGHCDYDEWGSDHLTGV